MLAIRTPSTESIHFGNLAWKLQSKTKLRTDDFGYAIHRGRAPPGSLGRLRIRPERSYFNFHVRILQGGASVLPQGGGGEVAFSLRSLLPAPQTGPAPVLGTTHQMPERTGGGEFDVPHKRTRFVDFTNCRSLPDLPPLSYFEVAHVLESERIHHGDTEITEKMKEKLARNRIVLVVSVTAELRVLCVLYVESTQVT